MPDQRVQLIKRHKATEQACEIRPHHLTIVQTANKREIDVRLVNCFFWPTYLDFLVIFVLLVYKAFDKRSNDELHRHDLKIINEIDLKVTEQQDIMQKAGVFGFFQTSNVSEVKLQMHLFQSIQKLSQMNVLK